MDKKVKAFVDIQCGKLHCIDKKEKEFNERCHYLPYLSIETLVDKNAKVRCALFDEPLKEDGDNFFRCAVCRDAENE
jgi:hypothetical protein